jgi:hypothetical protein
MPEFLSVFCRSAQSIPLAELRGFIRDGWFFEQAARIEPISEGVSSSPAGWAHVEIHYQESKRPVVISHLSRRKQIEAYRAEALEELRQQSLQDGHLELMRQLQDCQQIFILEVDSVGATEACWAMVDALEAWLARTCDGVIFVSGEGFYDAALQPLCKLSP